jgi:putative flippase GtrA
LLRRLWKERFLRFLVVGGFNTAFNYGVYALCVFAGTGHVIAATISFVVGILVGFATHGRIVFQSPGGRGFVPFVLSWLLIYVVYVAILDLLVRRAGINEYVAGAAMLPVVVVLSFLILRFVVFRGPRGL